MKRKIGGLALIVCLAGAAACGPAPIRPLTFPDPAVPCPAGLISWKLDVIDRRAEPEDTEKMVATVRSGIEGSFPGCRWTTGASETDGTPTITITVHRLGVAEHDRYQDAAAEWTVTAASSNGSTMTEFEANEEESRPAYPDADEEALNEAFRKALQRTVKGLAAMQRLGSARPPEGTFLARGHLAEQASPPRVNR
jgi:hypothetical protein